MRIGKVESLWRYPVKSMRGEELPEAFFGVFGVKGDRLFAIGSSSGPEKFPYLTGREQAQMLLYRPRSRQPETAAQERGPQVEVETPSGGVFAIDDPELLRELGARLSDGRNLSLLRAGEGMTDCQPVSLFSIQTAEGLGDEIGAPVDKRRFRANLYADIEGALPFAEDWLVGRTLKIGSTVQLSLLEKDSRCVMVEIDPDTAERDPSLLRQIAKEHEGSAGVYASVLVEGIVRTGDRIELLP